MKIKKLLFPALLIGMFASCSKNDDVSTVPEVSETTTAAKGAPAIPSYYTQKLMMEMYCSANCATCPDAEMKYRDYAAQYPDKVYGVCIHQGDAMNSPQFSYLSSLLGTADYAAGSFNRMPFNNKAVLPKTAWTGTVVNSCLNQTAMCGLKINSTMTGNTLYATAYAGFNQSLTGNYCMTVYLLEDNVTGSGTGYDQANYFNNMSNSPFFHLGNPIVGYQHDFVLRKVITQSAGDPIPPAYIRPGGVYYKSFSINIAGYKKDKLKIVAFINKLGTSTLTNEVMNVQQAMAGESKNWD